MLVVAIDAFRYDAGTAWLNFLATLGSRFSPAPVERMPTPERLAEWLAHEGLAPAVSPGEADLGAAYELRAALAHVVFALVDGAASGSAGSSSNDLFRAAPAFSL